MKEGKEVSNRERKEDHRAVGEAKALKGALFLYPGSPKEQEGKEECVRGDQAGTGAPSVRDPTLPTQGLG